MSKYYVGIDLGGTSIKLGIIDETGNIVAKQELPTPHQQYKETLELFIQMIENSGVSKREIIGIGIGVPGFVDVKQGTIEHLVNVGWQNVQLKRDLEALIDLPVFVDNDANLAALGELINGAGKGTSSLLCVTIGTGIGAGIIINGEIYHGKNWMAGEIGHMPINPLSGRLCNCGRVGCLETEASATAIVNYVIDQIGKGNGKNISLQPTTKDIFELAKQGDALAIEAIDHAAYYLGLALAQISHAMAPEIIVIGGGVSKAKHQIIDPIKNYFSKFSLPKIVEQTKIVHAKLENDAGMIGAALLARHHTNM